MNWVRNHVQSNGWRGVVNLSLGGPTSPALNDAAAQLIAAGIPVATRCVRVCVCVCVHACWLCGADVLHGLC